MTIRGRPGTILEVTHGTLTIEFDPTVKHKDVLVICECHLLLTDRSSQSILKEEDDSQCLVSFPMAKKHSFEEAVGVYPLF